MNVSNTVVSVRPGAEMTDRSLADGCRTFMSGFPTGVVVVTGAGADGEPFGLTCSSLISVTLTPPTLLVSVHVRSRTLAAIRCRAAFGVNLLHARARPAAELFASRGSDRFASARWTPRGRHGLPWLTEEWLWEVVPLPDHAPHQPVTSTSR